MRASLRSATIRIRVSALCAAAALAAVAAPAAAGDVFKGETLYKSYCASCHGPRGRGVMPGVPDLSRGENMIQPDVSLLMTLRSGKNAMPAYFGILKDSDLLDVIAFTRTLMR